MCFDYSDDHFWLAAGREQILIGCLLLGPILSVINLTFFLKSAELTMIIILFLFKLKYETDYGSNPGKLSYNP